MKYLLLLTLLFTACGKSNYGVSQEKVVAITEQMTYILDDRKGLCFAFIESTTYAGRTVVSFTNVPLEACQRKPSPPCPYPRDNSCEDRNGK